MTLQELYKKLESLKLPIAYHHYDVDKGDVPKLPYLIYFVDGRRDFIADNINYVIKRRIEIELYTQTANYKLAEELEKLLIDNNLAFGCIPFTWIDTEGFYMSSYTITI